jgi:hypothetical protein
LITANRPDDGSFLIAANISGNGVLPANPGAAMQSRRLRQLSCPKPLPFGISVSPTLDSCKRVTADAERLKCYDKAASAPSPKPSEAEMGEAGWWIVLGSIDIGRDNNITAKSGRKREIVERAAAKCGYQAFNDYSMKFKGMASGYNVVVPGPYRSKSAAGNILESVRRCVPDAYIRQTEYAGE